jgi:glycosyltransferase involved in cell wall biosynthesis
MSPTAELHDELHVDPVALPSSPGLVVDLEMSEALAPLSRRCNGREYDEAWLLVRVFAEPVGLVRRAFSSDELSVAELADAVTRACGPEIAERVAAAHANPAAVSAGAGAGLGAATEAPFLAAHARWLVEGPTITVVICTRNRPVDLRRALQSLKHQSYQRFEVLVVDNAPTDRATADLVRDLARDGTAVGYTMQPRPGLSWARNHALDLVDTSVVAWLDDDEVADRHWLMEIAAGFCLHPGAAAVSGSVVPAQLDTRAQLLFEEYGGHTKGRGFRGAMFLGRNPGGQSAVYPLPAFGVGANMAFDVATLKELGGFDVALGAGTATLGGEDTLVFSQLLLQDRVVVYRPSALTRHYHRPDYASLQRQMAGYGIGLTAYYTSLLRYDWTLVFALLRLTPRALRDMFGRRGQGMASVTESFPQDLLKLKTKGMVKGPFAYLVARRNARRLTAGAP